MSFWGMVLTGAVIFAQVCDEDTSPPPPVAPAMAPGSAAPVAFDNAFGDGGIARVSLSPSHDRFMAVTIAPDGAIYGAGYVTVDGDQHMAVARMTPQGVLDS